MFLVFLFFFWQGSLMFLVPLFPMKNCRRNAWIDPLNKTIGLGHIVWSKIAEQTDSYFQRTKTFNNWIQILTIEQQKAEPQFQPVQTWSDVDWWDRSNYLLKDEVQKLCRGFRFANLRSVAVHQKPQSVTSKVRTPNQFIPKHETKELPYLRPERVVGQNPDPARLRTNNRFPPVGDGDEAPHLLKGGNKGVLLNTSEMIHLLNPPPSEGERLTTSKTTKINTRSY